MTLEDFESTLELDKPPADLPELLKALWYSRKGNWDEAHRLAQEIPTQDGAWVHAHLHRQEGDLGNAGYWYSRAGRPAVEGNLVQEWQEISRHLLSRSG